MKRVITATAIVGSIAAVALGLTAAEQETTKATSVDTVQAREASVPLDVPVIEVERKPENKEPVDTPTEEEPTQEPSSKENTPTQQEKATVDSTQLCPTTAYGDQGAVDSGALVLWMDSPYLIAGHDNMGWAWLDDIPNGTVINVTCGPASGAYKITGHQWHDSKGGTAPSWIYQHDLVLQTCTGSTGTGFSTAERI